VIHFQVLGALDLRRDTGERIGSLLAHPKRMGILLHLVLDQPGRPVERSLLASRFWPDSPVPRAQASLRTALSQMRSGLGPGVLEADGQQVWLIPDGLSCDALQLLAAVEAGQWREAATLARGELTPGFELDDQLEFQRWLDAERERFRRAALTGLRARADELAAHDPVEADLLLVRASVIAPFDSAVLQQRLLLCERRGARSDAATLFHAWRDRLRTELDLEPSPDVVALYERITGAPPANAPVPAQLAVPSQAVSPHAAVPAQAVSPHAAVSTHTPETAVPAADASAGSAPAAMAPDASPAPHPTPVTAPPATPAATATGPNAGALRTEGARGLFLRVAIVVLLVVAGGWSVLRPGRAVDRQPPPTDAWALALIDTGMAQHWSGDEEAALASFTAAVDIDPDAARAHYGIMLAAVGLGRRGPLEVAGTALKRLRPAMSTAQSRRLDALLALPDEARAIYRELAAAEPDSLDVVFHLADLEFHWGSSWGVPRDSVRAKFERIEASGRADVRALRHLTRLDAADADLDALRRRTARLRELGAPALDILTGSTLEAILDTTLRIDVAAVAALPSHQRTIVTGAVAAVPTRPDRVDAFLADLHAAVPESGKVELALWNALAAAGRGRLERAGEWLDSVAGGAPARADEFRAVVATLPWLPADAGLWNAAARVLASRRETRLISPFDDDFLTDAIYAPRATFLEYLTHPPRTDSMSWDRFQALDQSTAIDLALKAAYIRILDARRFIIAEDSEERGLATLGPPAAPADHLRPWLLHHPFAVERYLRVQALMLAARFEEATGFLRGWPDPSGYDRAYLAGALTLAGDVAAQRGDRDGARREYRRAAEALRGADPAFRTLQYHIERQLERLGG